MYGVPDDGQSQPSPSHISCQPTKKTTKEDVQKQVTLARPLHPAGRAHPSEGQSWTQTDEPLLYLASSLLSLSDYLLEHPAGQALYEGVQSGR